MGDETTPWWNEMRQWGIVKDEKVEIYCMHLSDITKITKKITAKGMIFWNTDARKSCNLPLSLYNRKTKSV